MISGSAACAVMMWVLAQSGAPSTEGTPTPAPTGDQTSQPSAPTQSAPEAASSPPQAQPSPEPQAPVPSPVQSPDDTPRVMDEPAPEAPATQKSPDAEGPADTAAGPAGPKAPGAAVDDPASASRKPKPTRRTYVRRPNTISFNGALAVFGVYAVALERALSSNFSIVLEPSLISRRFQTTRGTTTANGFGFAVSARWFPLGSAPDGPFVAPEMSTYNLTVREAVGRDNGTAVTAGAWAGYSVTFLNLIHLSAGVGGQAVFGKVAPSGILYRRFAVSPLYRVNAGFSF